MSYLWKEFVTKYRVKRSIKKTKKTLIERLCDYRKPFHSTDLHALYCLLKKQGAKTFTSPVVGDRYVEVSIDENKIDWFSFRIKYSVPTMDITIKISVRAGAPQVMSSESDTIFLNIESIFDNDRKMSRQIIERSFEFINAIDAKSVYTEIKTPKTAENIMTIKKVLASAFSIIIEYLIDWRRMS